MLGKLFKRSILVISLFLSIPVFSDSQLINLFDNEAVNCLARNVYHEARGEPAKGQLAVALVTLNRAQHSLYPSNICSVVYAKNQFSWTNKKLKISDSKAWKRSLDIAYKALSDYDNLSHKFKATHFHHKTVNPGWNLKRLANIGNHVFYMHK